MAREAIAELERMGFVERVLDKGASVRLLGVDDVSQIYSVGEALETLAASCRSHSGPWRDGYVADVRARMMRTAGDEAV